MNSRSAGQEVARWVKCFQNKREDLNSQNPQLALEHASVVTAFPWGHGGVETGEAIGAHVTDSLAHIAVNDRTYLKRGGGQGLVVL